MRTRGRAYGKTLRVAYWARHFSIHSGNNPVSEANESWIELYPEADEIPEGITSMLEEVGSGDVRRSKDRSELSGSVGSMR